MDSQESSLPPQFKSNNSLVLSFLYSPTLTSIHDSGKTIALTMWTFVSKVMSLLFNMLSRLVIAFLPRSKRLFIWPAINSFNNTNIYFSKHSVVSSFKLIISCNLNKDLSHWPGFGIARKRVTLNSHSQMSVNLALVSSHIYSKHCSKSQVNDPNKDSTEY